MAASFYLRAWTDIGFFGQFSSSQGNSPEQLRIPQDGEVLEFVVN